LKLFRISNLGIGIATAVVLVLVGSSASLAQSSSVRVSGVRFGFKGKYKVGDWTPVWVTLEGGESKTAGRLELTVLDGDGVEVTYLVNGSPPLEIPGRESATALEYVKFGRVRSHLTIRLRGEMGVLAERTFTASEFPQPLPAGRELIVTLGGDAGVADAARQMRRRAEEQIVPVAIEDASLLPDDWRGYDGVDTLVLLTSRSEFLDQLSGPRRDALLEWVRLGGRVLVSVGSQGDKAFGDSGVLADLAPGRFAGVTSQRRTGSLEHYINAGERLDTVDPQAGELLMTVLATPRGRVEVAESAGPAPRPIVMHYPVGFGRATLIAVDVDRGPISVWRERPKLMRALLEAVSGESQPGEREGARGRVSHFGYEDLSGQLRAALDAFPGVTLIAFSWVAALIVFYIALIGPADYFFLRRFAGGMERTWLTFPAIVALVCLAAWIGVRYSRANRLLVNRVELVDVDVESGLARGTAWAHVYSPKAERFDVSLTPNSAAPEAEASAGSILTWQGLPGGGLGGMNSTAGKLFNAPYDVVTDQTSGGLQVQLRGMPIQVRSTRSLAGRWWATVQIENTSQLSATSDGRLTGELVNPLNVPLRDCYLAYSHWSYVIPQEAAPGGTIRFDRRLPDGNLVWRLTQKYVGEDYKEFATPWDEANRDVPRVLEMLFWHEAAGGRSYTGLLHRHHADLDLSHHLRTGRAVLVGRGDQPAAELSLNGRPPPDADSRRWTWYRVVYPVVEE
jgi:hypothetical protein